MLTPSDLLPHTWLYAAWCILGVRRLHPYTKKKMQDWSVGIAIAMVRDDLRVCLSDVRSSEPDLSDLKENEDG